MNDNNDNRDVTHSTLLDEHIMLVSEADSYKKRGVAASLQIK